MSPTYLLVLGTPRSGTTLLAAMIGRHEEVAMLNEDFGWAVRNLVGKEVAANKLCVPNQIELNTRARRWHRLLQRYGFFERRPESFLSIADYLEWEPLKLVATLRDGNAVISSIMKRGGQTYEEAAYRWRRGVEIIYELSEQHPDRFLLIPFEELVSESEQAMRAAADHLGLSYQPRMLEGPAYTPIYDNKEIDSSKATKNTEDFELKTRYPEAYRKYSALLEDSLVLQ